MRRLIILSILSTLFLCSIAGDKVEGKIIFNNDSIINVTFIIPINLLTNTPKFQILQNGVKYFDANGAKTKLLPGSAKEIQFVLNDENIRMLTKYYNHQMLFLKISIDGRAKLYDFYFNQNSPVINNASTGNIYQVPNNSVGMYPIYRGNKDSGSLNYAGMYLLQKGDEELIKIKVLRFKKEMCEFFNDCPALVKKIKSGSKDMEAIVRFYNSECN